MLLVFKNVAYFKFLKDKYRVYGKCNGSDIPAFSGYLKFTVMLTKILERFSISGLFKNVLSLYNGPDDCFLRAINDKWGVLNGVSVGAQTWIVNKSIVNFDGVVYDFYKSTNFFVKSTLALIDPAMDVKELVGEQRSVVEEGCQTSCYSDILKCITEGKWSVKVTILKIKLSALSPHGYCLLKRICDILSLVYIHHSDILKNELYAVFRHYDEKHLEFEDTFNRALRWQFAALGDPTHLDDFYKSTGYIIKMNFGSYTKVGTKIYVQADGYKGDMISKRSLSLAVEY